MTAAATFGSGRVRIAIDAMGGDHAPGEIVRGAILASRESADADLILVGREEEIRPHLDGARLEIVDAREVVTMEDGPLTPLRRKKDSSIRVCANLVAEGSASAFVSAGNTGAAWTSARMVMKMVEGVDRPALAAVFPRLSGHTLILDVGANVDSKPAHLRQFAVMGHFYSQMLFGLDRPRVGLLSIGEEIGKGNEVTKETYRVLAATGLNFVGNAEGRDVFNGNVDVVVCDGFTGNVVLKASEALAEMITTALREELTSTLMGKIGGLLASRNFDNLKKRLDYAEYGGAPLVGVRGGCVICHGRSDARAIKNAVRVAKDFVEQRINEKIREKMIKLHDEERAQGLIDEEANSSAISGVGGESGQRP